MFVLQRHLFVSEMVAGICNTGKEENTEGQKINYADLSFEMCTYLYYLL